VLVFLGVSDVYFISVVASLVVSTSEVNGLERLVSKVTHGSRLIFMMIGQWSLGFVLSRILTTCCRPTHSSVHPSASDDSFHELKDPTPPPTPKSTAKKPRRGMKKAVRNAVT